MSSKPLFFQQQRDLATRLAAAQMQPDYNRRREAQTRADFDIVSFRHAVYITAKTQGLQMMGKEPFTAEDRRPAEDEGILAGREERRRMVLDLTTALLYRSGERKKEIPARLVKVADYLSTSRDLALLHESVRTGITEGFSYFLKNEFNTDTILAVGMLLDPANCDATGKPRVRTTDWSPQGVSVVPHESIRDSLDYLALTDMICEEQGADVFIRAALRVTGIEYARPFSEANHRLAGLAGISLAYASGYPAGIRVGSGGRVAYDRAVNPAITSDALDPMTATVLGEDHVGTATFLQRLALHELKAYAPSRSPAVVPKVAVSLRA